MADSALEVPNLRGAFGAGSHEEQPVRLIRAGVRAGTELGGGYQRVDVVFTW
jgi:hypothetical protein